MDGQMSIFDFPEYLPDGKEKKRVEIKTERCNGSEEPNNEVNVANDYDYHDISEAVPPEGTYCEFEYTWSYNRPNDRKGICKGWWRNGKVLWNNMPNDIGKKTLTRWIRVPEGLKPTILTIECEHDHKCLCDRWHGGDEQIKADKFDLLEGFSCSGCCYNCSQAPMHGGKCKHECRVKKEDFINEQSRK